MGGLGTNLGELDGLNGGLDGLGGLNGGLISGSIGGGYHSE